MQLWQLSRRAMRSPIKLLNPADEIATFDLLKLRLLLRRLDEIPLPELHAAVMREADLTSILARQSGFPLLTFPCLFAERTARLAEHQHQQSTRYWQSLAPAF